LTPGRAHIGGGVTTASIANTTISNNAVRMTNSAGHATAFSGGLHTDGVFTLSNDLIANNSVHSDALGAEGDASADSGAGEMAGTLSTVRLTGNTVEASSAHGNAGAGAGAAIFTGTLTNGTVSGNQVSASAPHGSVSAIAGALQTGGPLTLQNTAVNNNTASGTGTTGYAEGGGIYAVDLSPNGPPGGPLVLTNSAIVGNALHASKALTVQGGGLYVTNPLTNTHSTIEGNTPDNCAGTSC
jgi:fibronectin-binding autotransporter adhesin